MFGQGACSQPWLAIANGEFFTMETGSHLSKNRPGVFLTAHWRHLAMVNYAVDPSLLRRLVPEGTEIDFFEGRTFVSVVGFLFQRTGVFGISFPFHRNFEEVNLRIYVRHRAAEGWRRGVVFIREIVPRRAIAFLARTLYCEPYVALPMDHRLSGEPGPVVLAEYGWNMGGAREFVRVEGLSRPMPLVEGSLAQFISEHYWGYNRQRSGATLEYQVAHPPWRVSSASQVRLECDVERLYGTRVRPGPCGRAGFSVPRGGLRSDGLPGPSPGRLSLSNVV